MKKQVLENHEKFVERNKFYKKFGIDQIKEREFILNKSLPIEGNILEIGTGKGHFAYALAKTGYRFTSVDINKEELDIAGLNLAYYDLQHLADFKIEDACCLSFPDKSFDVIFCINVYHHLKTPFQVLGEMLRILSLKGKIILGDFNKMGMDIVNKCHEIEGRKHDCFKDNLKTAKEFFTNRGFNICEENSFAQELLIISKRELL